MGVCLGKTLPLLIGKRKDVRTFGVMHWSLVG